MKLSIQKVESQKAFAKVIDRLVKDVEKHGGSASQVVDSYGTFHKLTACAQPGGILVINEVGLTKLEVLADFFAPIE